MALDVEGVVGCGMHREKSLRGSHALEPLARFVARLTDAETTPGVARIAFSTRSTQESQAMPSTRMLNAAGFFGLEKREDIDVSFTNDLVRCWPVGP